MPDSSPWDDIAVPSADFNVRQVPGGAAVPCFWGRDTAGACLFIMELQGDHTTQYRKNAVTAYGINVDLRGGEPGQQRLVLTVEKQVDRDLFEGLCHTLASALECATDSASSLAVALGSVDKGASQRSENLIQDFIWMGGLDGARGDIGWRMGGGWPAFAFGARARLPSSP